MHSHTHIHSHTHSHTHKHITHTCWERTDKAECCTLVWGCTHFLDVLDLLFLLLDNDLEALVLTFYFCRSCLEKEQRKSHQKTKRQQFMQVLAVSLVWWKHRLWHWNTGHKVWRKRRLWHWNTGHKVWRKHRLWHWNTRHKVWRKHRLWHWNTRHKVWRKRQAVTQTGCDTETQDTKCGKSAGCDTETQDTKCGKSAGCDTETHDTKCGRVKMLEGKIHKKRYLLQCCNKTVIHKMWNVSNTCRDHRTTKTKNHHWPTALWSLFHQCIFKVHMTAETSTDAIKTWFFFFLKKLGVKYKI